MSTPKFQLLVLGLALGIVSLAGVTMLARAQQAPPEIVCVSARVVIAGAVDVKGQVTGLYVLIETPATSESGLPTYPQVQMCALNAVAP